MASSLSIAKAQVAASKATLEQAQAAFPKEVLMMVARQAATLTHGPSCDLPDWRWIVKEAVLLGYGNALPDWMHAELADLEAALAKATDANLT